MPLPPVQVISQTEYFVSGDVSIDETAVVAAGVVLQAAPNSQIKIAAGVCIGMGTILNAYGGIISIESGVTLGPGVLIIGRCLIGEGACVGTTTTIINSSVEALSLIPAGSLLGDTSRSLQAEEKLITENLPSPWDTEEEIEAETKKTVKIPVNNPFISKNKKPEVSQEPITETVEKIEFVISEIPTQTPIFTESKQPVVGQVYINQLLITLFPERQKFNNR